MIGVDDSTMSVAYSDCGDRYEVEHDAFGGIRCVLECLTRRPGRER